MKNSLFHHLQKKGTDAIVFESRPHYTSPINLLRFVTSPSPEKPFPVTVIDYHSLLTITDRFLEEAGLQDMVRKENGHRVVQNPETLQNKWYHLLADTPLPARNFGIEVHKGVSVQALAFQIETDEAVPRLRYAKGMRTYMLAREGDAAPRLWQTPYVVMPPKNEYSQPHFFHADLLPGLYHTGACSCRVAAKQPVCAGCLAEEVRHMMMPALALFHVLAREPMVVQQLRQERFAKENILRKLRKKPCFSAVTEVTVNAEALRSYRLVKAHSEIATQLRETGHYSIPGLQLVSAYRRKNGANVPAYAKCANEIVRREATTLLRADPALSDPATAMALARLVEQHGTPTTIRRHGLSPLRRVKLEP